MANNEYVNKVEFGDTTIMDISDTTADAGDVIEGEVFYTKSGARSVGTLGDATQSTHGLMSTTDKTKLDGIDLSLYAPKAHPIFTGSISMGRKTGTNIGEGSVATGYQVSATDAYSHAEGSGTTASNSSSHAEGTNTTASGMHSHAEGYYSSATSSYAHAEGYSTTASTPAAHAEGYSTTASGARAHAEGYNTQATSAAAHAEGDTTRAEGAASHAEGMGGSVTSSGTVYVAAALGTADHVEGYQTRTGSTGNPGNHAEGYQTAATGGSSHSEGAYTLSSGSASHSEGFTTTASGTNAHAEGAFTTASGTNTHAEGTYTTASEGNAHAEGAGVVASGNASHAEGLGTIAAGSSSHAGGEYNIADSYNNFAEWEPYTEYYVGDQIKVTSTSNGNMTVNSYICKVDHTSGESFSSATNWKSASGKMAYAEIIGNGTSGSDRSNARALTWNGDERLKGDLYVNCNNDSTGGYKVLSKNDLPIEKTVKDEPVTIDFGTITISSSFSSPTTLTMDTTLLREGRAMVYIGDYTDQFYGYFEMEEEGWLYRSEETSSWPKVMIRWSYDVSDPTNAEVTLRLNYSYNWTTPVKIVILENSTLNIQSPISCNDSISLGRREYTDVGRYSATFGKYLIASGQESLATGLNSEAVGDVSHAEGQSTTTIGVGSHAEGVYTTALGMYSHAEGVGTVATGTASHVSGIYNVVDEYNEWSEWAANTSYSVGDKVKITKQLEDNTTEIKGWICITSNSDAEFTLDNWKEANGVYAEIVGNGDGMIPLYSNARALDWEGNEYLNGDLYVECDSDSTNGKKVATELYVSTAISNIVLPTKVSDLTNDSGFLTSVPVMTGATSSAAGTAGLVPAPATTDVDKFLAGDGTYKSGGLPMVILSYGNSTWAQFEAAYKNNVIVYTRASSNSNPASGSQTRMAFMAYVNNATTPTEVEFQYYRSMSSHSATAMGDQVFVYKLNKTNGWSVITRDASIKEINVASGSKLGVSWSSNKVTLSNTMTANDMPMSSSDATTTKAAIEALDSNIDGAEGTMTLSYYSGTYTGGIYNQSIRYKVCGPLVLVNGSFKMSADATSSTLYAAFSGIPFASKFTDVIGHLRCSNDGILMGGVKVTSVNNTSVLVFYFNKMNNTYALKDQTIEFTIIYSKA